MAYEIDLLIDNRMQHFTRNNPPTFQDITSALIIQDHQVGMDPGAYLRTILLKTIEASGNLSGDEITDILKQFQDTLSQQPKAEDQTKNMKLIADFASQFWGNQFSADEVITGATQEAINVINTVIDQALGGEDKPTGEGEPNPKD